VAALMNRMAENTYSDVRKILMLEKKEVAA
jgi:hypothetical protein